MADSRSTLHRLTALELQRAGDGNHSDGGGLLLRVRGASRSWVYRFTSPTARRREMGPGKALLGSTKQAGDGVKGARELAHAAREQLRRGVDPIDARDANATAARQLEQTKVTKQARERLTLARAARGYHERVIEASRTAKHGAQGLQPRPVPR